MALAASTDGTRANCVARPPLPSENSPTKMVSMRNLLLVSYHFPPHGGSGVQRALKLAKYLPESGWRAHVICAAHRHYPVMDATLGGETGSGTDVYPTYGWDAGSLAGRFGRRLGSLWHNREVTDNWEDRLYWRLERWQSRLPLPEQELSWVPSAIARSREVVRRSGIEAVITTSPPHVSHYIGRHLKKRMGIPWIADLRDPIVDNFAGDPNSAIEQRFRRSIERMIVHVADRVIVTCPELAEQFRRRYSDISGEKIITIPNGFDASDAEHAVSSKGRPDIFTMTHVGAFYRQQTIGPIIEAVRRIRARRADAARELRFRVVGTLSLTQRSLLRDEDSAFVEMVGYKAHVGALSEMASADALVLTTPGNDGGRLCIPAKTFEYMAFGGHIVAYVHPETAVQDWLRRAGGCTLLNEPTANAWEAGIERAFDAWRSGNTARVRDAAFVASFRRDRQAGQIAKIVDACAGAAPRLKISLPTQAEEAAA